MSSDRKDRKVHSYNVSQISTSETENEWEPGAECVKIGMKMREACWMDGQSTFDVFFDSWLAYLERQMRQIATAIGARD